MKKFIVLAVIVGLLVPVAALAAAEFSLGGYVKMEVLWDSTQINKNLLQLAARNNDRNFHHGRLKFTAENTRMNFTIKGPKVFGATTTGFIEWDFDNASNQVAGWESPHKARIEIRHAMFRLNWPETELLMGQYWSILTEEIPEVANFGACTTAGQPFVREPQIRLTQTFGVGGGKLEASFALAQPMNGLWGLALNDVQAGAGAGAANNPFGGESSETPKLEGRVKYDIDLWGKAAFWGKPRPFSVRAGGAWWRERFVSVGGYNPAGVNAAGIPIGGPGAVGYRRFGQIGYLPVGNLFTKQQYLNHYMLEASMFVPLLPTHSANLAGTASLLTQWWVGQGLDGYYEDFSNSASFLRVDQQVGNNLYAERELMQRFGGFIQLQYYFTNQWFTNLVWGVNKAFGVDRNDWIGDPNADPFRMNQHYYASLWYRPIQALKFGLEYTYVKSDYFQKANNNLANAQKVEDTGENHRVMFAGFFFF